MSQTDVVVFSIKRMITEGQLGPGAKLPVEQDLAEALSVSRGSLREGVRALSIMGVLETRQGAGTYVTSLEPSLLLAPMSFVVELQSGDEAANLHAVRRYLETEAAGLAALHMDEDALDEAAGILDRMAEELDGPDVDHEVLIRQDLAFHRIIADHSGNSTLAALIAALAGQTIRGRLWRAIREDEAERSTLGEHRVILNALREHSSERARLRMANHLLAVEEFLHDSPPAPASSVGIT